MSKLEHHRVVQLWDGDELKDDLDEPNVIGMRELEAIQADVPAATRQPSLTVN